MHPLQILGEVILVCDAVHSCIVVDSLEGQHFLHHLGVEASVRPIDIPIKVFVIIQPKTQLSAGLFNDSILGLRGAQNELRQVAFRLLLDRLVSNFLFIDSTTLLLAQPESLLLFQTLLPLH